MTLLLALELIGWTIIAVELAGKQGHLEQLLEQVHNAIAAVVYPIAAFLLFDQKGQFDGQRLFVIGFAIGALIYIPGYIFYPDRMFEVFFEITYGGSYDREVHESISGPIDDPGIAEFALLAVGTILIGVGLPALFLFMFAKYPGGMLSALGFCLALTSSIAARLTT
ncbi:MAG: hypothetical protein AAFY14_11980 [Pseudomonadota bacterium]